MLYASPTPYRPMALFPVINSILALLFHFPKFLQARSRRVPSQKLQRHLNRERGLAWKLVRSKHGKTYVSEPKGQSVTAWGGGVLTAAAPLRWKAMSKAVRPFMTRCRREAFLLHLPLSSQSLGRSQRNTPANQFTIATVITRTWFKNISLQRNYETLEN